MEDALLSLQLNRYGIWQLFSVGSGRIYHGMSDSRIVSHPSVETCDQRTQW